jgi:endonuclease G, mitochondrial
LLISLAVIIAVRVLQRIFQMTSYGLMLLGLCTLASCWWPASVSAPTNSPHLLLGNPSQATPNLGNPDNYLMLKPQYALSYSRRNKLPNWVAWRLQASDLAAPGTSHRQNDFRADPELPSGWPATQTSDYTRSGFDRGHLTNSEDRSSNPIDNSATFLMTNIIPQSPDNNRGVWVELENYCRKLVRAGKELYIVAGPHGQGGVGDRGASRNLAGGQPVPASTWKVVLVLDRPGAGLAGVNQNTRAIAVVIPNIQGIKNNPWRAYRTTVREVEKLTGYDFFNTVPANIQEAIEQRVDDR